jgi:hypothetical protein
MIIVIRQLTMHLFRLNYFLKMKALKGLKLILNVKRLLMQLWVEVIDHFSILTD